MIILCNAFRVLLLGGQRVVIIQDFKGIFFFWFLFVYISDCIPNYMFLKKNYKGLLLDYCVYYWVPLLCTRFLISMIYIPL